MKRIPAFLLLVVLSLAGSIPVYAQRMTPEENARQSRKAARKQQKYLKKANKKQRKAMKKYEKSQRKATNKANKQLKQRRG
jgi:uncharacterized protein HemX